MVESLFVFVYVCFFYGPTCFVDSGSKTNKEAIIDNKKKCDI